MLLGTVLLHPAAHLLIWLFIVLAVQALSGVGLLGLAVLIALVRPAMLPAWWGYIRRSRWLLLTLWLILAFNTPGDAWLDQAWAPTEQGLREASLQAARLVLMLGLLAGLFATLGRDGLVAALWGLCLPLRSLGIDTAPFVVRLSLVLDHQQHAHRGSDWRAILQGALPPVDGPETVKIDLPAWRTRDTLGVLLGSGMVFGVVLW